MLDRRTGSVLMRAGLAVFLLLVTGCGTRTHDNPLDPDNPSTGGRVPGFRAVAGDGQVALRWSDLGLRDLASVAIERRLGDAEPETVAVCAGHLLAWTDTTVQNGIEYTYRLRLGIRDDPTAYRSDPDAAVPGAERVWVVDEAWGGLRRVSPDGRDVAFSVAYPGYLRSVALDRTRGRVWAVNPVDDELVRVNDTGGLVSVLAVPGARMAAVDESDGTLWVAGDGGVFHLSAEGAVLFADPGVAEAKDIAVDSDRGLCYVAEGTGTLWIRHADGTTARVGGFTYPFSLSLGEDGSVWMVDAHALEVYRLTPGGVSVAGPATGFGQPVDIAAAPGHRAWVADWDAGSVVCLEADLRTVASVRGFDHPRAVAAGADSHVVWVAEAYGGRVVKISAAGERLGTVSGLDFPKDLVVGLGARKGRSGLDRGWGVWETTTSGNPVTGCCGTRGGRAAHFARVRPAGVRIER